MNNKSTLYTSVQCVKASGVALIAGCTLMGLECPQCSVMPLESTTLVDGVHIYPCCGYAWEVSNACANPIAGYHPYLTGGSAVIVES